MYSAVATTTMTTKRLPIRVGHVAIMFHALSTQVYLRVDRKYEISQKYKPMDSWAIPLVRFAQV